jgi:hypothetical protein
MGMVVVCLAACSSTPSPQEPSPPRHCLSAAELTGMATRSTTTVEDNAMNKLDPALRRVIHNAERIAKLAMKSEPPASANAH